MARLAIIKARLRTLIRDMKNEGKTPEEIGSAVDAYLRANSNAFKTEGKNSMQEVVKEFKTYQSTLGDNVASPEVRKAAAQALRSVDSQLAATGKNAGKDISDAIQKSLGKGDNTSKIVSDLNKNFKKQTFVNESIVQTAKRGFNRLNSFQLAIDAGVKKFRWAGPSGASHPLCKKNLDQVFTIEQIQGMRNSQVEPVEAYMGGYRCRHHWEPILDDIDSDSFKIEPEVAKKSNYKIGSSKLDLRNEVMNSFSNNEELNSLLKANSMRPVIMNSGLSEAQYYEIRKFDPSNPAVGDTVFKLRIADHHTTLKWKDRRKDAEIRIEQIFNEGVIDKILKLNAERPLAIIERKLEIDTEIAALNKQYSWGYNQNDASSILKSLIDDLKAKGSVEIKTEIKLTESDMLGQINVANREIAGIKQQIWKLEPKIKKLQQTIDDADKAMLKITDQSIIDKMKYSNSKRYLELETLKQQLQALQEKINQYKKRISDFQAQLGS